MTALQNKAESGDFTSAVSNFGSEHTQRILDLRSEVFAKISEIHT